MIWTTSKLFYAYFGSFCYPFESADEKFLRMKEEERLIYMNAVYNFVESKAFRIQFQELVRTFYAELASKPQTETMVAAYRLILIFIRDWQKHLVKIHDQYKNIIK